MRAFTGPALGAIVAISIALAAGAPAASVHAQDVKKAVADLERELVDDSPAVRSAGAAALADRYPEGTVAIPMLVDLLDDEDPEVAAAAARSLESLSISALPPLAAYCSDLKRFDPKSSTGKSLFALFGKMAPTARDVLARRDEKAKADDPGQFVIAAVRGFDLDGTETEEVSEMLAGARAAGRTLADQAAAALATYGGDAAAPRKPQASAHLQRSTALAAATRLLGGKTDVETWAGARLLARLRPDDAATCTALLAALGADRTRVNPSVPAPARDACVAALGSMGAAAGPAVPRLLAAARGEEPKVDVIVAVEALTRLGKSDELHALLISRPSDAADIAAVMARRGIRTNRVCDALLTATQTPWELLQECGAAAVPTLPRLRTRLAEIRASKGPSYDTIGCATTILLLDARDEEAMVHLENVLLDPKLEDYLRDAALRGLARAAPNSQDVANAAGERIARAVNGDVTDFWFVVDWLPRRASSATQAVPDLMRLAATIDAAPAKLPSDAALIAQQRRAIAAALGRIGHRAAAAIPVLERWRDKADEMTRARFARELRRIRAAK